MASPKAAPVDYSNRAIGMVLLPLFAYCFWIYTYLPITDALHSASTVDYSGKFVFIQPYALVAGLIYIIFGENAAKFMGPTSKPSAIGWSVLIVSGILGGLAAHYLKVFLIAHGYAIV